MTRFLHSADLHLGKTFGQVDAEERARLQEARLQALDRLADGARTFGASHVILAGDTWDSDVPSARVLRQSLETMAGHGDLVWVLLPGNHDRLRDGGLWERIAADRPANTLALLEAAPTELADGLWLLPAPCTTRDPGRDITAWMDNAPTPDGALRIGVAHGSVTGFGEEQDDSVIDPGRAGSAGLDYMALGDWHGWIAIDERTLYPGTPEPDRFREGSGFCAAVEIEAPGVRPHVRRVPTGTFAWVERSLDAGLGEAPDEVVAALVPEGFARRNVLLSMVLTGTASLADRASWIAAIDRATPSFADVRVDMSGLGTLLRADDLDDIDRQGALRDAAEVLRADMLDEALAPDERAAARRALDLLFSWSASTEPGA